METTKTKITRREAIDRLAEIFSVKRWIDGEDRPAPSFYIEDEENVTAEFFINKEQFERLQVLNILRSYFEDKVFGDDSACSVFAMTILWTSFSIVKFDKEEKEVRDEN